MMCCVVRDAEDFNHITVDHNHHSFGELLQDPRPYTLDVVIAVGVAGTKWLVNYNRCFRALVMRPSC